MGRRGGRSERLKAPSADYVDAEGNVLTLRGSLSAGSRRSYAEALAGNPLSREDAWQRAVELLFELLALLRAHTHAPPLLVHAQYDAGLGAAAEVNDAHLPANARDWSRRKHASMLGARRGGRYRALKDASYQDRGHDRSRLARACD